MPNITRRTIQSLTNPRKSFSGQRSQSAKERQRMYNNRRWRSASALFRKNNPLCIICKNKGIIKPSQVTDHIKPHKGNLENFWDASNWQAICNTCHNTKSAKEK